VEHVQFIGTIYVEPLASHIIEEIRIFLTRIEKIGNSKRN
jgi:hypothetical protein